MADTAKLLVQLGLKDGLTGPLGRLQGRLKGFSGGLGRVGTGVGQIGAGLARVGVIAGGVAVGGLVLAARAAIDFESAFAGVRKTVQGTPQQLNEISAGLRNMALEIPVSVIELARIAEQAGALGVARKDILEFTRVVALLAVTTDLTSETAASALGHLQNVLKLGRADLDNFGAALVALGNKGASTESEIIAIAERAGAAADLIGFSDAATLGWSASLANLGIESESAGSSIQRFLLGSLKNIQDDDTLNIMAKTAGTTGQAFRKAFEQDASAALQKFIVGLSKLTKAEQLAVLEALGFSDVRISRAILGLAGNTDNLNKSLRVSGNAWRDNTALTEEARKRFRTTQAELQKLGNALFDVGITIGTNALPPLRRFAQAIAKLIRENQPAIKKFGRELGNALSGFVTDFQAGKFNPIIDALKSILSVGKSIAQVFLSLPKEVIAALAGFAIANRASGGLLGTGLGNIVGGLKDAIAGALTGGLKGGVGGLLGGRGATPLNPLFVKVVGGLPGIGGGTAPSGKGGGFLGGALKVAVVAFAGAAATDLAFQVSGLFDPRHINPESGRVFRSTNVPSEQIATLEKIIPILRERAASGDAFAQKQLAASVQQLAALKGVRTNVHAVELEVLGAKRVFAERLAGVRIETIRAAQRAHATELATKRGFTIANRALGISNSNLRGIATRTLHAARANERTAAAVRAATGMTRIQTARSGKANSLLDVIARKKTSVQTNVNIATTLNTTVSAAATGSTLRDYYIVKYGDTAFNA